MTSSTALRAANQDREAAVEIISRSDFDRRRERPASASEAIDPEAPYVLLTCYHSCIIGCPMVTICIHRYRADRQMTEIQPVHIGEAMARDFALERARCLAALVGAAYVVEDRCGG